MRGKQIYHLYFYIILLHQQIYNEKLESFYNYNTSEDSTNDEDDEKHQKVCSTKKFFHNYNTNEEGTDDKDDEKLESFYNYNTNEESINDEDNEKLESFL